jgi:hypothetical protein
VSDTEHDEWLTAEELSQFLWSEFRIKRNTRRLGQLRATGGGPGFHRDGLVVRYRKSRARVWAEDQLGEEITSTSEESARRLITSETEG